MTVTRKQRINYSLAAGIAFAVGAFMGLQFGIFSPDPMPLIWLILLCALMSGGIVSGFILLIRSLKLCSIAVKILVWVFFPITILAVSSVGMVTLIPYYIYNLICISQKKYADEPARLMPAAPRKRRLGWAIAGGCLLLAYLGNTLFSVLNETTIANDIYKRTGCAPGSPDNLIIRQFCYDPDDSDYTVYLDYDYDIKDSVLFVLTDRRQGMGKIKFPNVFGQYTIDENTQVYRIGGDVREDLDRLFSECHVARQGGTLAYMLILDARSRDERIEKYLQDIPMAAGIENIEALSAYAENKADRADPTYAEPDELELADETGEPIPSKALSDGKYVIYYDVVRIGDTGYSVTASYQGETYQLLTYDDIVNFRFAAGK